MLAYAPAQTAVGAARSLATGAARESDRGVDLVLARGGHGGAVQAAAGSSGETDARSAAARAAVRFAMALAWAMLVSEALA